MKYLVLLGLLICTSNIQAQDATAYDFKLRIAPTDTTENVAKMMIADIAQYNAKDYQLVFIDSQRSRTYTYMFSNPQQDVLRITYKYSNRDEGKIVTYMSISAELGLMTSIYNYIFQTGISPQELMTVLTTGTMLEYENKQHQFILQSDDTKPGYWNITFI